jgi:hypothetical protein
MTAGNTRKKFDDVELAQQSTDEQQGGASFSEEAVMLGYVRQPRQHGCSAVPNAGTLHGCLRQQGRLRGARLTAPTNSNTTQRISTTMTAHRHA